MRDRRVTVSTLVMSHRSVEHRKHRANTFLEWLCSRVTRLVRMYTWKYLINKASRDRDTNTLSHRHLPPHLPRRPRHFQASEYTRRCDDWARRLLTFFNDFKLPNSITYTFQFKRPELNGYKIHMAVFQNGISVCTRNIYLTKTKI